jgi:phosphate starvation-inducible PhoH-like protein
MEKIVRLNNIQEAQGLFGLRDENIRTLEEDFGVKIFTHGDHLKIKGKANNVAKVMRAIEYLIEEIRSNKEDIDRKDLHYFLKSFKDGGTKGLGVQKRRWNFAAITKNIGPRTQGQRQYVEAIKQHDIVFGIGPAGTGKTYLAMACAVEAFKKGQLRRIILTRPAIEAGESLGFLPGDVYEKILPYLRPLYDALYDMMDAEQIEKYLETGTIEVAPLAYMRGRTLNDAFIILDEAQNCTVEQMKMFLTRLGFDSKAVITGDITQSDLPGGKPMGLIQAEETLHQIEGIKFVHLSGSDVVRHSFVQKIIEAYENQNSHK